MLPRRPDAALAFVRGCRPPAGSGRASVRAALFDDLVCAQQKSMEVSQGRASTVRWYDGDVMRRAMAGRHAEKRPSAAPWPTVIIRHRRDRIIAVGTSVPAFEIELSLPRGFGVQPTPHSGPTALPNDPSQGQ